MTNDQESLRVSGRAGDHVDEGRGRGRLGDDSARSAIPESLAPSRREFLERLQKGRFTSALHPVTAVRLSLLFEQAVGMGVDSPETDAIIGEDGVDGGGDLVATFVNALCKDLPLPAREKQSLLQADGIPARFECLIGVLEFSLAAADARKVPNSGSVH